MRAKIARRWLGRSAWQLAKAKVHTGHVSKATRKSITAAIKALKTSDSIRKGYGRLL